MTQNLLHLETSPYLLQHKDNPIHWMAWGEAAFTRARSEDKPILLSAGYAACHWCHVMAHESFEDPEIAAIANAHFVSIKLDREERPDVDKLYMDALHALGEHGGWPLTMFLTPEGRPFWGGTYFPKTPRFGKPGFAHVLSEIARIYKSERGKVDANATALFDALSTAQPKADAMEITSGSVSEAATHILRGIDMEHGGLKGSPKFPQAAIFKLLHSQALRTGHKPFHRAVETTLARMCQGGIYDHLGGGLSRYSVDHLWLVPHFEKMLYDNAEFVGLLARAWICSGNPLFRVRLEETVQFLVEEMRLASGAFASSYDADSEGHEGTYYVWSEAEIDSALGSDADVFKAAYGVTAEGNFEGKTILNRMNSVGLGPPEEEAVLAKCRSKLLEMRRKRVAPGFDDKAIASWNGMAITGLAEAARLTGKANWLTAARSTFAAILHELWDGNTLFQSARNGTRKHLATIDGYASLTEAALLLHALTAEASYLSNAQTLADSSLRQFWNDKAGAFDFTSRDARDIIVRSCFGADDATPNGNAVMAANLLKLWRIAGDPDYEEKAHRILDRFSAEAMRQPFAYATMLGAAALRADMIEAVITDAGSARARELLAALARMVGPDIVVTPVADPMRLAAGHPARRKSEGPGARLYLCRGMTCAAPAETVGEVEEAVRLLGFGAR